VPEHPHFSCNRDAITTVRPLIVVVDKWHYQLTLAQPRPADSVSRSRSSRRLPLAAAFDPQLLALNTLREQLISELENHAFGRSCLQRSARYRQALGGERSYGYDNLHVTAHLTDYPVYRTSRNTRNTPIIKLHSDCAL